MKQEINRISLRNNTLTHFLSSTLYTAVTVLVLGCIYPLVITGIAQLIFPQQAGGSLLLNTRGVVIGSELVGQNFSRPEYFQSRPSAAGTGYDPMASSGTNLGPTSKKLLTTTHATIERLMHDNGGTTVPPADLVSSSASGLDPDISPAAAAYQVPRVAKARHLTEQTVQGLVAANSADRDFGIFGEPRVHVLDLNIALDKKGKL